MPCSLGCEEHPTTLQHSPSENCKIFRGQGVRVSTEKAGESYMKRHLLTKKKKGGGFGEDYHVSELFLDPALGQ